MMPWESFLLRGRVEASFIWLRMIGLWSKQWKNQKSRLVAYLFDLHLNWYISWNRSSYCGWLSVYFILISNCFWLGYMRYLSLLNNDDDMLNFLMGLNFAIFIQVLIKMLPSYYQHVCRYENTLVTKFYGVHCVKPVGGVKVCLSELKLTWTLCSCLILYTLIGCRHGSL